MANDELDIEATNHTRVSMGLAPLPVPGANSKQSDKNGHDAASSSSEEESDAEPEDTIETRSAAADENFRKLQADKNAAKKREERRTALKKKQDAAERNRTLEGPTLGDANEGDDDDVTSWLKGSNKRQKAIEKERAEAAKQEEIKRKNKAQYTEKDLKDARVAHEMDDFEAGEDQILTLKDANVDDDSAEDQLENAQLVEKEKTKERMDLKRKRPAYDPSAVDENGERGILGQYDDKKDKSFTIGKKAAQSADADPKQPRKFKFDLSELVVFDEQPQQSSDYVDGKTAKAMFKKKKKTTKPAEDDGKVHGKPAKVERPKVVRGSSGDALMNGLDSTDKPKNLNPDGTKKRGREALLIDDDDEPELRRRRAEASRKGLTASEKRQKQKEQDAEMFARLRAANKAEQEAQENPPPATWEDGSERIVLDETTRFMSELAKRDLKKEYQEDVARDRARREKQRLEEEAFEAYPITRPVNNYANGFDSDSRLANEEAALATAASSTDTNMPDAAAADAAEADDPRNDDPSLNSGMGSWVKTLSSKGIWKGHGDSDANHEFRQKQKFLTEKRHVEEAAKRRAALEREQDRSGRMKHMSKIEREEFSQQQNAARDQEESQRLADAFDRDYKPNVELRYVDQFGRDMTAKEAFKDLSHQFHGKGSGNMKTEKQIKRVQAERAREAQSSLDATGARGMDRAAEQQAKKNKMAGVRLG